MHTFKFLDFGILEELHFIKIKDFEFHLISFLIMTEANRQFRTVTKTNMSSKQLHNTVNTKIKKLTDRQEKPN